MTDIFQPLLPPTRLDLFEFYKKARSCMWYEDEIVYLSDIPDYETINSSERHFIELILGFFAISDRIVLSNLIQNFIQEIDIPEAKLFYNFQAIVEDIHSLTYTNHLITLVKTQDRLNQLIHSVENFPCIQSKTSWALRYMNRDVPIAQRLIAFAIVEGVFFSASFCSIFWFKTQNKFVKGIGVSNEFISRDEALHCDFACYLYKNYFSKVSKDLIIEMLRDAYDVESNFVNDLLSETFNSYGMNRNTMKQYIQYVIDKLSLQLIDEKIFFVTNPFPFMMNLTLNSKTNFFEKRVTEYSKISISSDSLLALEDF